MRFRRLIDDYLNPEIKDLQRNLMDLARPKSFPLTASLSSRCWLPSSCWLSTSSIAPQAAFRGQAQSTVGGKKTREGRRAEFGGGGGQKRGLRQGWRHCGKIPRQVKGRWSSFDGLLKFIRHTNQTSSSKTDSF